MTLRDILYQLAAENGSTRLTLDSEMLDARKLLDYLPEPVLDKQAYLHQDLFITEIDDRGFMGEIVLNLPD